MRIIAWCESFVKPASEPSSHLYNCRKHWSNTRPTNYTYLGTVWGLTQRPARHIRKTIPTKQQSHTDVCEGDNHSILSDQYLHMHCDLLYGLNYMFPTHMADSAVNFQYVYICMFKTSTPVFGKTNPVNKRLTLYV